MQMLLTLLICVPQLHEGEPPFQPHELLYQLHEPPFQLHELPFQLHEGEGYSLGGLDGR